MQKIIYNPIELDRALKQIQGLKKRIEENETNKQNLLAQRGNYSFLFKLKKYNNEICDKALQCSDMLLSMGYDVEILIEADGLDFTYDDFDVFINMESNGNGIKVSLVESGEKYSVEQTLNAFAKCKSYAEYVKSKEASPLEKYLMIYRFVTSRAYQEETDGNVNTSRNLISILNNDEIVCVGYAKLLKYLCNEVGIKCETQILSVDHYKYSKNDNSEPRHGRHENNIIYLKDDKYGIDGYYYADACWDAVRKNKEPYLDYIYAFVPLSDVNKMSRLDFDFDTTNAFYKDYDEISLALDADRLFGGAEILNECAPVNSLIDEYGFDGVLDRVKKAGLELKSYFRKHAIPGNFYAEKGFQLIPRRFNFEFLMSLLMANPPQRDKVNEIVKEMRSFALKNGQVIDKKTVELGLYCQTRDSEDVYHKIERICDYSIEMSCFDAIERYYENYEGAKVIYKKIEQAKSSSKPIDLQTFYDALISSLKIEGYDEERIDYMSERVIIRNYNEGRRIFDEDACNCFVARIKDEKEHES